MASAGETLLEQMRAETPEATSEEPVVNETQETPVEKPRRQRKPKPELSETPAEPVAETPDETPAPAEKPEWLRRVESDLGFQNATDEVEVRDRLVDFAVQQRQERERLEAEYQQKIRDLEYRQVASASERVPEKPQEDRKPWQPPVQYPAAAARYLDGADESGNPNWKPETPAEVRAQTEKYIAWRDDMREAMLHRPDVFFGEILPAFIDEHAKKVIEPFYEQRTAEQQRKQFFDSYASENAEWLYTKDPTTGQPSGQLSRTGQLFDQQVSAHLERGHSPQDAVRYARLDVQEQTGQAPWTPAAPSPDEIRAEKRKATLRKSQGGAMSVPQRTGSFTEPEDGTPQNGHVSPGQSLLNRMRREGIKPPFEAAT